MSNNSLSDKFFEDWLDLKKKAVTRNTKDDWEMYIWFLKEAKKEFSKVYAGMKNEKWIETMGEMIRALTCEIKGSNIKYKELLLNVKKGG